MTDTEIFDPPVSAEPDPFVWVDPPEHLLPPLADAALLQAVDERDQMIQELRNTVATLEQANTAFAEDGARKQQVIRRLENEAREGKRYLENLERALRILDRVTE